jgi:ParB/RepB/Spo0J family partition protein
MIAPSVDRSSAPHINAAESDLLLVPTDKIDRNPDNPRIIFRPGELDQLLDSIKTYGVQVPISVYRQRRRFVLIDGERRWRCCAKLGITDIPALVQRKPSPLENLLLMFNIHALREQWDLLTIALKLNPIIELIRADTGKEPTERELATKTGLTRAVLRRCRYLLNLPVEYHDLILTELEKPKAQQRLTEDLFIEMERALKTVERAMPELIQDAHEKDRIRRVLIDKYEKDIIPNRVHFRKIARIARADRTVNADRADAERALERLFSNNQYSIEKAYDETVSELYEERDIVARIDSLVDRLRSFDRADLDDELRAHLRILIAEAQQILESAE